MARSSVRSKPAQIDVAAGTDGLLIAPENKVWQLLDKVKKDQVIAYWTTRSCSPSCRASWKQVDRLRAELQAASTQLKLDQDSWNRITRRIRLRLTWELEQRRVDGCSRRPWSRRIRRL